MAIIDGSIGLTGIAAPKDDTEKFPTIDPLWGIDGLRSVTTIAARNAIVPLRRRFGMMVSVTSDPTPSNNGTYRLSNTELGGVDNNENNNSNWTYFDVYTDERTRNTILTTLNLATYTGPITSGDSIVIAFARLQNQIGTLQSSLSWKNPVEALADTNVTLSGETTINTVVTNESRVALNGQTDPKENGIYITSSGAWTRTTDADSNDELLGAAFFVLAGDSVHGNQQWNNQTNPVDIGNSDIHFGQIGATVSYTAGPGISIVGNSIELAGLNSGQILVGNASNIATARSLSGDATLSNTGVLTFANTGVTGGTYEYATVTVNSKGLITDIEAGTPPIVSPLSTKGDIYTFSTDNARLPIGANNTILVADSAATTGNAWKTISTILGYTPEQQLSFSLPLSRLTNTVSIGSLAGLGAADQLIRSTGTSWEYFTPDFLRSVDIDIDFINNSLGYTAQKQLNITAPLVKTTATNPANDTLGLAGLTSFGSNGQLTRSTGAGWEYFTPTLDLEGDYVPITGTDSENLSGAIVVDDDVVALESDNGTAKLWMQNSVDFVNTVLLEAENFKVDVSEGMSFVANGGAILAINETSISAQVGATEFTFDEDVLIRAQENLSLTGTQNTLFFNGVSPYFKIDHSGTEILNINQNTTLLNTANLHTKSKFLILNKGGATNSGAASGIAIEEGGTSTGYLYLENDDNCRAWLMKAPDSFEARLDLSTLAANRNYIFPNKSGTIALLDDIVGGGGSGTVTSISGGSTGFSFSLNPATPVMSGTLVTGNGGTGLSSLGSAGQGLVVNSSGTGLEYADILRSVDVDVDFITNSIGYTPQKTLTFTSPLTKTTNTNPANDIIGIAGLTTVGSNGQVPMSNGTEWAYTTLATVAATGSYNDLSSKPTIPAQVNLINGTNVTITGSYPNLTINASGGGGGGSSSVGNDTAIQISAGGGDFYGDDSFRYDYTSQLLTIEYLGDQVGAEASRMLIVNEDGEINTDLIPVALTTVAFGSSTDANGGSISGSTITLQPASATTPGGVSITAQSMAGIKTMVDHFQVTDGKDIRATGVSTNFIRLRDPADSNVMRLAANAIRLVTTSGLFLTAATSISASGTSMQFSTSGGGAGGISFNTSATTGGISFQPGASGFVTVDTGSMRVVGLAGGSTQMVVASTNGTLGVQTLPTSFVINNNADNRVVTANGTAGQADAEANLTFDGSTLSILKTSGFGAGYTPFVKQGQFSTSETSITENITSNSSLNDFTPFRSSIGLTGKSALIKITIVARRSDTGGTTVREINIWSKNGTITIIGSVSDLYTDSDMTTITTSISGGYLRYAGISGVDISWVFKSEIVSVLA